MRGMTLTYPNSQLAWLPTHCAFNSVIGPKHAEFAGSEKSLPPVKHAGTEKKTNNSFLNAEYKWNNKYLKMIKKLFAYVVLIHK